MAEAEELANSLFEKAKSGVDFDKLIKNHSDDEYPGIFQLANFGYEENTEPELLREKILSRSSMPTRFGDVSFSLDVGDCGLAVFHPDDCIFGWHVIKRIR